MNIHEVIEYGPVVFTDEELDVLVTVNGAYFNWWNGNGEGDYHCSTCRYNGSGDLYTQTVSETMDLAKAWYNEEIAEMEEER